MQQLVLRGRESADVVTPRVLHDRTLPVRPRVTLILLDWSCRESFHILDYLREQDVPRDWFEVLWVEYFDRAAPQIAQRIAQATAEHRIPPVDRWIALDMPRTAYYHKHVMYNLGVLASRGELVMIGDSDAMVTPRFVRTLIETFERDREIVLHLDEVRSHNRAFYPFNYPTFEDVIADGCINWQDGKTTGLLDEYDPLHSRNYGACICARRDDVITIGGADEHPAYMGHVCGPYDLTWRLVNLGRREVWHEDEFLYHVWHPGSDGEDNYVGPHDGFHVSTLALATRRNRRVMPLVENPVVRAAREGRLAADEPLTETLSAAIGNRPFSEWVIDDEKRALSEGRAAWTQHRHADAIARWQPVMASMSRDAKFLSDVGWSYYFVGSHDMAKAAFERSVTLEEDNPEGWRGLGWVMANRGEYGEAIRAYTRAIRCEDPLLRRSTQEAYRGRAWAYLHHGRLTRANEDFSAALALTSSQDHHSLQDVNRGLGWIAMKYRRWGDARFHFLEAVRLLSQQRGAEYENAMSGLTKADAQLAKSGSGTSLAANAATNTSVRRSAKAIRSQLVTDLATTYQKARRYKEALSFFRQAHAVDPTNYRASAGVGWAALHLGRLVQANAAFKRLLNTPGVDAASKRDAFHGRAWIAYRQGRMKDAVKDFMRALQITDPPVLPATLEQMRKGLRRARYIIGSGNLTLMDIARKERTSVLHLAMNLQARSLHKRVATLLGRTRRRPHQ